jgi:hypothetical protein
MLKGKPTILILINSRKYSLFGREKYNTNINHLEQFLSYELVFLIVVEKMTTTKKKNHGDLQNNEEEKTQSIRD